LGHFWGHLGVVWGSNPPPEQAHFLGPWGEQCGGTIASNAYHTPKGSVDCNQQVVVVVVVVVAVVVVVVVIQHIVNTDAKYH
jgi:hypothetical protein